MIGEHRPPGPPARLARLGILEIGQRTRDRPRVAGRHDPTGGARHPLDLRVAGRPDQRHPGAQRLERDQGVALAPEALAVAAGQHGHGIEGRQVPARVGNRPGQLHPVGHAQPVGEGLEAGALPRLRRVVGADHDQSPRPRGVVGQGLDRGVDTLVADQPAQHPQHRPVAARHPLLRPVRRCLGARGRRGRAGRRHDRGVVATGGRGDRGRGGQHRVAHPAQARRELAVPGEVVLGPDHRHPDSPGSGHHGGRGLDPVGQQHLGVVVAQAAAQVEVAQRQVAGSWPGRQHRDGDAVGLQRRPQGAVLQHPDLGAQPCPAGAQQIEQPGLRAAQGAGRGDHQGPQRGQGFRTVRGTGTVVGGAGGQRGSWVEVGAVARACSHAATSAASTSHTVVSTTGLRSG